MRLYVDLVIVLNFLIDGLLLVGANRLAGFPAGWVRVCVAAALGGLYAGVCMLPGFRFLGSSLWRVVFLALMGLIAYGLQRSALPRTVLFALLSMALGGIALGLGNGGFLSLVAAACGVCLMCVMGFRGKAGGAVYVPVELKWAGRKLHLTALMDTGNGLVDPLTGQSVIVLGADVARKLTGLTPSQLASPVDTLTAGVIPGLRLIPYRAVGQPGSMLLGMRMEAVRIGGRSANTLVAFAPNNLSDGGAFQALTGGAV